MGLTREQAIELRKEALLQEKQKRKVKVDEIMAKSISIEDVEKKLRKSIVAYPHESHHQVVLLNVVTNDWGSKEYTQLREEVYEMLKMKYLDAFFGAKFISDVGNQSIGYTLTMDLDI